MWICTGLVDAVLPSKILGILTQILIALDCYYGLFFFCISEKYLQFRKKQLLLREIFGLPHASNGFSNYTYLKHMYITLKGIGKNLFVSILRILVICKFLNFMVDFTKRNLNFSKLAYNFPCGKVNFSLILGLILNIFFDESLDSAILTQNSQFPYFSFSLKLTFLTLSE